MSLHADDSDIDVDGDDVRLAININSSPLWTGTKVNIEFFKLLITDKYLRKKPAANSVITISKTFYWRRVAQQ